MWVDHQDYPSTIRQHHAHEAVGSSALRRLLTDEQPSQENADLGNALGWLAVTPAAKWDAPSAEVVQRPDFRGRPQQLQHWLATNPEVIGLTKSNMKLARQMADALQASDAVKALVGSQHVQHEHTVIARHERTGVLAKARPDWRVPGLRIDDLKMTKASDPTGLATSVRNCGYDVQQGLYHRIEADRYGLERLRDGANLIVVSRTTFKVGTFGLANWLARGERILERLLDLQALKMERQEPPLTMLEVPQQLPPPTRWDRTQEERIIAHVEQQCA